MELHHGSGVNGVAVCYRICTTVIVLAECNTKLAANNLQQRGHLCGCPANGSKAIVTAVVASSRSWLDGQMEAVPTRAAYGGRSQRARLVYLLGMHIASMCKCT